MRLSWLVFVVALGFTSQCHADLFWSSLPGATDDAKMLVLKQGIARNRALWVQAPCLARFFGAVGGGNQLWRWMCALERANGTSISLTDETDCTYRERGVPTNPSLTTTAALMAAMERVHRSQRSFAAILLPLTAEEEDQFIAHVAKAVASVVRPDLAAAATVEQRISDALHLTDKYVVSDFALDKCQKPAQTINWPISVASTMPVETGEVLRFSFADDGAHSVDALASSTFPASAFGTEDAVVSRTTVCEGIDTNDVEVYRSSGHACTLYSDPEAFHLEHRFKAEGSFEFQDGANPGDPLLTVNVTNGPLFWDHLPGATDDAKMDNLILGIQRNRALWVEAPCLAKFFGAVGGGAQLWRWMCALERAHGTVISLEPSRQSDCEYKERGEGDVLTTRSALMEAMGRIHLTQRQAITMNLGQDEEDAFISHVTKSVASLVSSSTQRVELRRSLSEALHAVDPYVVDQVNGLQQCVDPAATVDWKVSMAAGQSFDITEGDFVRWMWADSAPHSVKTVEKPDGVSSVFPAQAFGTETSTLSRDTQCTSSFAGTDIQAPAAACTLDAGEFVLDHVFKTAGTYKFTCHIHSSMGVTINVLAAPTTSLPGSTEASAATTTRFFNLGSWLVAAAVTALLAF